MGGWQVSMEAREPTGPGTMEFRVLPATSLPGPLVRYPPPCGNGVRSPTLACKGDEMGRIYVVCAECSEECEIEDMSVSYERRTKRMKPYMKILIKPHSCGEKKITVIKCECGRNLEIQNVDYYCKKELVIETLHVDSCTWCRNEREEIGGESV